MIKNGKNYEILKMGGVGVLPPLARSQLNNSLLLIIIETYLADLLQDMMLFILWPCDRAKCHCVIHESKYLVCCNPPFLNSPKIQNGGVPPLLYIYFDRHLLAFLNSRAVYHKRSQGDFHDCVLDPFRKNGSRKRIISAIFDPIWDHFSGSELG